MGPRFWPLSPSFLPAPTQVERACLADTLFSQDTQTLSETERLGPIKTKASGSIWPPGPGLPGLPPPAAASSGEGPVTWREERGLCRASGRVLAGRVGAGGGLSPAAASHPVRRSPGAVQPPGEVPPAAHRLHQPAAAGTGAPVQAQQVPVPAQALRGGHVADAH